MGQIVNLRLARKRKSRRTAEEKAEENRRFHGRTKDEKGRNLAERLNRDAFLDGHKLEHPEQDGK